jgi:adenylyltransferase/sulfurtransferase
MPEIPEITPTELKERLDRGERPAIIDVREPNEWQIGNLEQYGARLIPLGQLPTRVDEIPEDEEVVLVCRSGARSGRALEFLRAQGRERLVNLEGGMLAWSDQVDPSIPRY